MASHILKRLAAPVAAMDWDAVYTEWMPRVLNFFRYRVGDAALAEDLTATTFEKAWRARQRYRPDRVGVGAWLFAIARNVATDHFRQRRPTISLDAVAHLAAPGSVEEATARQRDAARLRALLLTLPEREQELIALRYGAELTNRAIAGLVGLSESNVGTILHRATRALRAAWEPNNERPTG